jgi:hypothetical protein
MTNQKGGIYFQDKSNVNNIQQYKYFCFVNTRSPTTPLLLPALVTQSLINLLGNKNISITPINAPFPLTYKDLHTPNYQTNGNSIPFFFSVSLSLLFAITIYHMIK